MVAIASPSVLVCSVTAVTSSNRVTSRLIVRPSVADSGSLLLCPQLHRARRDGCCTRDAAIADPRRLIEHGGQLVKKEELLRAGWADKGIAVRIGVIRIRRVERVIRIEGEAKGEEGVESVTMGEKEAVVPEVVGRSRGMPELSAEPKVAGSRVPEAELSTEPFDVPAAEAPAMTTSDGERDATGQECLKKMVRPKAGR